ncbi:phosphoglycerate mutase-like protein [Heliocybe sulcata]|uniref:Phosphoglycerate mutase-like protein n=1 Tax=Heliocybe sulcata TaxID=5364 RepID=A0A5C3MUV5_9AGAM|nr:phosphoglycerate mutase-like protein [Heliocybe sulcata]
MSVYKSVPGFFLQDSPTADPALIGPLPARFGLIDDSADRWATFEKAVKALNDDAEEGTAYKALWLGRHGEGWHNVAEANHWSKLNGDGEITWGPDPELTPLGHTQARAASALFSTETSLPLPATLYASPMTRALQTLYDTFGHDGRKVYVMENAREHYGEHTCDKRLPLTLIKDKFPDVVFEDGMTEQDELWTDEREAEAHVTERARAVLDTIFDMDDSWIISITSHSGLINGLLRAIGRERYSLPTGGVLPVVVKRTT